jgi:hypothetical protein
MDIRIDVFFGEPPIRDHPQIVPSIKEGMKFMRQKRKEGYCGIVMYLADCDQDDSTITYTFNNRGRIVKEKL